MPLLVSIDTLYRIMSVKCMSPCEDDLSVIIRYYCRNGRVCKKYSKVQENGKWENGNWGNGKMGKWELGKRENVPF